MQIDNNEQDKSPYRQPHNKRIYSGVTAFPNLFLFLTASASVGKGRLTLCRKLVYPIHKTLREQYKVRYDAYKQEKAMYNNAKKDQPTAAQPPFSKFSTTTTVRA